MGSDSGTNASREPPPLHLIHTLPLAAQSLPEALTRLFGREGDIARVSSALLHERARLVTVTGTGGIGKTRVAIEVARATSGAFPNGVIFVSLAPVKNSERVAFAIADQVGLPETSDFDAATALREYFESRKCLLVLDNFEHVLDAAIPLSDLLANCPQLTVLVTSRARLRVAGERELHLQPLSVPDRLSTRTFAEKLDAPAVQLFRDRARLARPEFDIDEVNIDRLAEICRMLDGLPLAIELAAARARYLSLPVLQEHLRDRVATLDQGFSDAPDRHQSLRAAIDWSHDLLTPDEQMVFRRLSVFTGTFTTDAAMDIAWYSTSAKDASSSSPNRSQAALESLVDKCLINAQVLPDETRFSLHETIRQYGQGKMADAGEIDTVRVRHAAHYLGLTRKLSTLLDGKDVARALGQIEVELPNIRAAMESALSRGDPETVLTIASALDFGWYYHGHLDEGRQYLKRALALDGASEASRLDGMFWYTMLAVLQGSHSEIEANFTSMCDAADRIQYALGLAHAYLVMGASHEFRGDPAKGERFFAEAIRILQNVDSPRWKSNMLMLQADVLSQQGDLDRAFLLASEALALSTEIGHTWTQANSNGVLAYVYRRWKNLNDASQCMLMALGQFKEIGDLRGIAGSIAGTAALVAEVKNFHYAAQLLGCARQLSDSIGVLYYTHYIHAQEATAFVQSHLGEAAFEANFAIGRSLDRDAVYVEISALLQRQLQIIPDNIERLAKRYQLTRKETEVYRVLTLRMTDQQIADQLFLSPRTVHTHVSNIISKLGVDRRWDAVALLDQF